MTPEALRRRMAHGNIYAAEQDRRRPGQLLPARQPRGPARAGPAVGGRPGRRRPRGLPRPPRHRPSRGRPASGSSWPSPGRPSGEQLIRRAARIAQRAHGELIGVHVATDDGPGRGRRRPARRAPPAARGARRRVPRGRRAPTWPRALVDVRPGRERHPDRPRRQSRGRRWAELVRGSVINRVVRLSGADRRPRDLAPTRRPTGPAPPHRCPAGAAPSRRCPGRRQLAAGRLAAVGAARCSPPCWSPVARRRRPAHRAAPATCCVVVAVAAVGGAGPGARRRASPASCWPTGTSRRRYTRWTIAEAENLLALVVFLVVAGVVSALVGVGRPPVDAEATRAAGRGRGPGPAGRHGRRAPTRCRVLVDHLRRTFGLRRRRRCCARPTDGWAARGVPRAAIRPPSPEDADVPRRSATTWCWRCAAGDLGGRGPTRRSTPSPPSSAAALERRRARGPGGAGRGAGRGRRAAHRAAPGGVPRPAHPAGVDQGVGHQPAPGRRRLDADADRDEFLATIERGDRPARPPWSATCST